MPFDPGPFDVHATRLVLDPAGNATTKSVTPAFYEELDAEFGDFAGHLLIAVHEFDAAWPTWEMHPEGDEFVFLLAGDVDFVLWTTDGEKTVTVDREGMYVVVPKGTWHTARPKRPSKMLFVTPGKGTENAPTPDAARAL